MKDTLQLFRNETALKINYSALFSGTSCGANE